MNYSQILEELISQTYSKTITWENENPHSWETAIFNYNFAFKVFSCEYKKENFLFKLLFVEKKMPDNHSDWEGIAEVYYPELIILQNGMQVGIIDDNSGCRDDLIRLGTAIENNNSGLNTFLNLFK